ncbi:hypothetical protein LguiB_025933 [Lonicera macranthoides]
MNSKRWSSSVTWFNLIRVLLYGEKTKIPYAILKLIRMDDKFKKYRCQRNLYDLEELKGSTNEKPKILYGTFQFFKKNRTSNVYDHERLKEVILKGVETLMKGSGKYIHTHRPGSMVDLEIHLHFIPVVK